MSNKFFPFVFASCLSVLASPGFAQTWFGTDRCAVVAASRPSLSEAQSWIATNGFETLARVFRSTNGWFAITAGVIPEQSAKRIIQARVEAGYLPPDAYCSDGSAYLAEENWREAAATQTNSTQLWDEFDARPLSVIEKRFLQASLALEGYYSGLLDGAWGRGSQSALEAFSRQRFQREPVNADAAALVISLSVAIENDGWEHVPMEGLAVGVMLPKQMQTTKVDGVYKIWKHADKELYLIASDLVTGELVEAHTIVEQEFRGEDQAYKVRNKDRWVTSTRNPEGIFYMRSDLIGGTWSTIFLTGNIENENDLNFMISSVSTDLMSDFIPYDTGVLMTNALMLLNQMEDDDEPAGEVGVSQAPEPPQAEGGSGSSFIINDQGVLLTNAHVIEGCTLITVSGHPAELVASSNTFDLAAISVSGVSLGTPLPFSSKGVGLNADITIAGYPLYGLLGGLNVSRGSISALKGLRGDETNLQISAPVQPGNSGGPAVDQYGNVVGVVVSKLDVIEVAELTGGDIAQNVNFAVRGDLAKVFLSSNGIEFTQASEGTALSGEALARRLQAATHLVECER